MKPSPDCSGRAIGSFSHGTIIAYGGVNFSDQKPRFPQKDDNPFGLSPWHVALSGKRRPNIIRYVS
jgi:hypothetical protein